MTYALQPLYFLGASIFADVTKGVIFFSYTISTLSLRTRFSVIIFICLTVLDIYRYLYIVFGYYPNKCDIIALDLENIL